MPARPLSRFTVRLAVTDSRVIDRLAAAAPRGTVVPSVMCSWFSAVTVTVTAPLGAAWVSAQVTVVGWNAAWNAGTRRSSRASNSPTQLARRSFRLLPNRRLFGDGGKQVGSLRAWLRQ